MSVTLELSDALVDLAKTDAAASRRTVPEQIEYWARLGKALDENPELPVQFMKDILLAGEEAIAGKLAPYRFNVGFVFITR